MSPVAIALGLAVAGASLAIAGAWLLWGNGWAVLVGALFCLVFSFFIFRGVRNLYAASGADEEQTP